MRNDRRQRAAAVVAMALGWILAGPGLPSTAHATGDDDLAAQQLAHSKKLYKQGVAAMKKKDFPTALARFEEAYRYAPELHVFTYNIASAADAVGDCKKARSYYQMFVGNVEEHPARAAAEKRLQELAESCPIEAAKEDFADPERPKPKAAPEDPASKALHAALGELRRSISFYERVLEGNKKQDTFAKVLERKRKHEKRLVELMGTYGVKVHETDENTIPMPDNLGDACERGVQQEKRNIVALESILEEVDGGQMQRVIRRMRWWAYSRHRPAFEKCAS